MIRRGAGRLQPRQGLHPGLQVRIAQVGTATLEDRVPGEDDALFRYHDNQAVRRMPQVCMSSATGLEPVSFNLDISLT
jgi:hypothetical protein